MRKYIFTSSLFIFLAVTAYAGPGHNGGHGASGNHWLAPESAAELVNPVAKDSNSLKQGRALYLENCASCHGDQARGDGRFGKNLQPKPADLAKMAGGHPDGDFFWKISNGRGDMPAWKDILREDEIWKVVNYIQNLTPPPAVEKGRHNRH